MAVITDLRLCKSQLHILSVISLRLFWLEATEILFSPRINPSIHFNFRMQTGLSPTGCVKTEELIIRRGLTRYKNPVEDGLAIKLSGEGYGSNES